MALKLCQELLKMCICAAQHLCHMTHIYMITPMLSPHCRFSVHVLIPCYKEPLDVIAGTVLAALNAHLPESTRRTVYLLDDGGSIEKRAFIESLENPQVGIVHFGSLFDA
jgi:hypothetical protein